MALVRSMKSKHILTQALAKRICTSCNYIHTKNLWTLFYYWFTTHHDIITQPQLLSCHVTTFIDHVSFRPYSISPISFISISGQTHLIII